MKPKAVLIEAVNKFLKEKLKEKGFEFSDSQLKFTKKLKVEKKHSLPSK